MQIQRNSVFLYLVLLINIGCANKQPFTFQNGDLFFQNLDSSPLCEAIELVTSGFNNGNFSHMGILIQINKKNYILEAFVNGVDTVPLNIFLNRSVNKQKPKVIVGRLKEEYSHLIKPALELGLKLINTKYDNEFNIKNEKLYCSELIYEIFYQANNKKPIFHLEPMTYKYQGKTLKSWIDYFQKQNIPIPENQLGINPGGISLSKKLNIIYNYQ